ncbi:MAG: hypothetical protein MCS20_01480, partial [Candidatus Phytoplasma mali]|nr:hypothetical protein [Candidatus Phytoplasma australiense]MBZ7920077.1 hypothetical protein [Candidatus Karelsulcia muelleri]MCG7202066.1 hypothetical protein [Candidatus Phytoplasma mali]
YLKENKLNYSIYCSLYLPILSLTGEDQADIYIYIYIYIYIRSPLVFYIQIVFFLNYVISFRD